MNTPSEATRHNEAIFTRGGGRVWWSRFPEFREIFLEVSLKFMAER